jgi:hypothetical protein
VTDLPNPADGTAPCNIAGRAVTQRRVFGWAALAAGVAVGVWAVLAGWPWTSRLATFPLLLAGLLGLLQARARL